MAGATDTKLKLYFIIIPTSNNAQLVCHISELAHANRPQIKTLIEGTLHMQSGSWGAGALPLSPWELLFHQLHMTLLNSYTS